MYDGCFGGSLTYGVGVGLCVIVIWFGRFGLAGLDLRCFWVVVDCCFIWFVRLAFCCVCGLIS